MAFNTKQLFNRPSYQVATAIAILFHIIGLIGILFFERRYFIQTSSLNLLLMFALLIWTQPQKNKAFWSFVLACFSIGFVVELIGIHTGLLFGDYSYGNALGLKLAKVPLIIAVNWFIIIYCSGIAIQHLIQWVSLKTPDLTPKAKKITLIIDAATLAVFFDWLMEPVAVKLDFWSWGGSGVIPWFNYVCWFFVSLFLLSLFQQLKFEKTNKYAVNLLLIQLMFFLILRTFL